MKEILVFRHARHEGPGFLAEFFERHELPHRLIRIDQNDAIPTSIDGVSGFVWMGGYMSVNDPLPWIPKVMKLVQEAVASDVPVLGHCLGGQLVSKALGGRITDSPVKEIGWFPVRRVNSPVANAWLDGLPEEFEVFHWHGETFSIPEGATRILASPHCTNQGFVLGKTLAFQCHIEMTEEMVRKWAKGSPKNKTPDCETIQSEDEMTQELEARVQRLQRVAEKFYERWIQGLR